MHTADFRVLTASNLLEERGRGKGEGEGKGEGNHDGWILRRWKESGSRKQEDKNNREGAQDLFLVAAPGIVRGPKDSIVRGGKRTTTRNRPLCSSLGGGAAREERLMNVSTYPPVDGAVVIVPSVDKEGVYAEPLPKSWLIFSLFLLVLDFLQLL